MPKISVIVPNFNHARFLEQRIDSILNQTFQDFELILLDDCSTDESRDILLSYKDNTHVSQIVFNEKNSGSPFKQWDKGIRLAKGEWIWIAESDDWAENTFLEVMLQVVEQNCQCVLASCLPCYVYPDGKTWHKDGNGEVRIFQGWDFARQRLVTSNTLPNVSALLIRRYAAVEIDFAAVSSMLLCGDWLMYAMLCEKGNVTEYNSVLSYFRQHGDNTTAKAERKGLSLIEGVEVLNYITRVFKVSSSSYAKEWGRIWAKKERQYQFDSAIGKNVLRLLHKYPSICFWHRLYQLRLALL